MVASYEHPRYVAVSVFVKEGRGLGLGLGLGFSLFSLISFDNLEKGFENADLRPAWHSHGCLELAMSLLRTCLQAFDKHSGRHPFLSKMIP